MGHGYINKYQKAQQNFEIVNNMSIFDSIWMMIIIMTFWLENVFEKGSPEKGKCFMGK